MCCGFSLQPTAMAVGSYTQLASLPETLLYSQTCSCSSGAQQQLLQLLLRLAWGGAPQPNASLALLLLMMSVLLNGLMQQLLLV
jgi:hypothetical protein